MKHWQEFARTRNLNKDPKSHLRKRGTTSRTLGPPAKIPKACSRKSETNKGSLKLFQGPVILFKLSEGPLEPQENLETLTKDLRISRKDFLYLITYKNLITFTRTSKAFKINRTTSRTSQETLKKENLDLFPGNLELPQRSRKSSQENLEPPEWTWQLSQGSLHYDHKKKNLETLDATLMRISKAQSRKFATTSRKFAAQIMTTGRTSETPFKELWNPLKRSLNQLEKHLLYSTLLCSLSSNLVCWSPVLRSWLTLVETSTGRGRGQPHPWSAPTAGHVTNGHWSHGLSDQCTSWIWLLGENRWLTFSKLTEESIKRSKKRER